MLTRTEGAKQRRQLWRDIQREERKAIREKLRKLREALKDARARRKVAIREAKERCRAERIAASERARALRMRALEELREATRLERSAARQACTVRLTEARAIKDEIERARAEYHAERKYHRDLRAIERANRDRRKAAPKITRLHHQSESDDEVRTNIPPDLVPLFEKVKRSIKAGSRMSRTEAFLKYAEEHPGEVFEILDEKTNAMIRELEEQERRAAKELRRPPKVRPSRAVPSAVASEVPF